MERERAINHKPHDGALLPESEQRVEIRGQAMPERLPGELKEFWLIEIWKQNREGFKTLIEHALAFLILIGSLVSINLIIDVSRLSEQRKALIESIDFYGIVLALGLFTLGFILKLIVLIFRKPRPAAES